MAGKVTGHIRQAGELVLSYEKFGEVIFKKEEKPPTGDFVGEWSFNHSGAGCPMDKWGRFISLRMDKGNALGGKELNGKEAAIAVAKNASGRFFWATWSMESVGDGTWNTDSRSIKGETITYDHMRLTVAGDCTMDYTRRTVPAGYQGQWGYSFHAQPGTVENWPRLILFGKSSGRGWGGTMFDASQMKFQFDNGTDELHFKGKYTWNGVSGNAVGGITDRGFLRLNIPGLGPGYYERQKDCVPQKVKVLRDGELKEELLCPSDVDDSSYDVAAAISSGSPIQNPLKRSGRRRTHERFNYTDGEVFAPRGRNAEPPIRAGCMLKYISGWDYKQLCLTHDRTFGAGDKVFFDNCTSTENQRWNLESGCLRPSYSEKCVKGTRTEAFLLGQFRRTNLDNGVALPAMQLRQRDTFSGTLLKKCMERVPVSNKLRLVKCSMDQNEDQVFTWVCR
eukprot:TRINITY_DN16796_c0_g3_i1.p1 TRINITY_DN16796_c0_g3~~TRINITY_DN16796_c0_g3_i1.p1  ORF type:complete len:450 (-),score=71.05 TRINITY_DN16796_c0_g3_i1:66-1415(-)